VTQDEQSKEVVREAGQLAGGVGAELVLLTVLPQDEYNKKREAMAGVGSEKVVYTLSQAEQSAKQTARSVASEVLADVDVDYEVLGAVGREADTILQVADDEGVDHLFLSGRRRSPTGKALFGDLTQEILLTFEGPVTVLLGDE